MCFPSNSSLRDLSSSNVLEAHATIQSNPLESIRCALRMRDSEMSSQPSNAQRRSYIDYSTHACSRWLRAIFDGASTVPPALTAAAALRQRKEKKDKKTQRVVFVLCAYVDRAAVVPPSPGTKTFFDVAPTASASSVAVLRVRLCARLTATSNQLVYTQESSSVLFVT